MSEKHPGGRDSKDDRIELENHLVGIYLIEEKKADWLMRDIQLSSGITFNESRSLLESGFRLVSTCE